MQDSTRSGCEDRQTLFTPFCPSARFTFGRAKVAQVESAKTPPAYSRVATLVLNEVDNLEKLFP